MFCVRKSNEKWLNEVDDMHRRHMPTEWEFCLSVNETLLQDSYPHRHKKYGQKAKQNEQINVNLHRLEDAE